MNKLQKDIERAVLKKLLRGSDIVYGYVEQAYTSEPLVSPAITYGSKTLQHQESRKVCVEFTTCDEKGVFSMMDQSANGSVPRYALVRIDD